MTEFVHKRPWNRADQLFPSMSMIAIFERAKTECMRQINTSSFKINHGILLPLYVAISSSGMASFNIRLVLSFIVMCSYFPTTLWNPASIKSGLSKEDFTNLDRFSNYGPLLTFDGSLESWEWEEFNGTFKNVWEWVLLAGEPAPIITFWDFLR